MVKLYILQFTDEETAEELMEGLDKLLSKTQHISVEQNNFCITFDDLTIDLCNRKVIQNNKIVILTELEFCLLEYLIKHIGQIMGYKQIYEAVWEEPYSYENNNIMTHISHLRTKLEDNPTHPRYIENIRGVGYRFIKE